MKKDTNFSNFFRKASSQEKEEVFMEVLKKATEEQQNYCPHARPEGAICASCLGINQNKCSECQQEDSEQDEILTLIQSNE